MGIFDKLKFWKHDEGLKFDDKFDPLTQPGPYGGKDFDYGLGKDMTPGLAGTSDLGAPAGYQGQPTGMGTAGEMEHIGDDYGMKPVSLGQQRNYDQDRRGDRGHDQTQQGFQIDRRDLEVVSVKLDSIRSTLESINTRLSAMENDLVQLKRRGGW